MAISPGTAHVLSTALASSPAANELIEQINALANISAAELAFLDGVVAGTGAASKALVLSSGGDLTLPEAGDIALGTTTGTKIGTATAQKLGFYNAAPVVQGAALTAQLTTVTHTAPSSDDFAIQDFVDAVTGAWAFASKDEANTLLKVVANLQARLAQVEARLETVGLIAAN